MVKSTNSRSERKPRPSRAGHCSQLLGETLQNAGLISNSQIQVVLADQEYAYDLRVGEIMALRGWIEQRTADFFADDWQHLIKRTEKYRLGYYFEKSGLLTEQQIYSILAEQEKIWVKFGSVAILQGLVKQKTVDFFLTSLFPLALKESSLKSRGNQLPLANLELDSSQLDKSEIAESNSKSNDDDDIPWID